ncbi:MAG: hypothetical protein ABII06_00770 [Pseudomonadota bacterium]
MNIVHYKGLRYCLKCQEETEHVLIYLDHYLKAGRCTSCGEEFNNRENLLNIYLHDMFERILSKPFRVFQEVEVLLPPSKKQISNYNQLIKRMIGKPSREIQNLSQILKKYDFGENIEIRAE